MASSMSSSSAMRFMVRTSVRPSWGLRCLAFGTIYVAHESAEAVRVGVGGILAPQHRLRQSLAIERICAPAARA